MLKKMKIRVKVNFIVFVRTTLERLQGSGVTIFSVESVCNIPEEAENGPLGYYVVPCAMKRKYKINCKYRSMKCYMLEFQRVSCIGIYALMRLSTY